MRCAGSNGMQTNDCLARGLFLANFRPPQRADCTEQTQIQPVFRILERCLQECLATNLANKLIRLRRVLRENKGKRRNRGSRETRSRRMSVLFGFTSMNSLVPNLSIVKVSGLSLQAKAFAKLAILPIQEVVAPEVVPVFRKEHVVAREQWHPLPASVRTDHMRVPDPGWPDNVKKL